MNNYFGEKTAIKSFYSSNSLRHLRDLFFPKFSNSNITPISNIRYWINEFKKTRGNIREAKRTGIFLFCEFIRGKSKIINNIYLIKLL